VFIVYFLIWMLCVKHRIVPLISGLGVWIWMHNFNPTFSIVRRFKYYLHYVVCFLDVFTYIVQQLIKSYLPQNIDTG
jgi:hypothetical protein